jgi:hypothetical protein
MDPLSADTLADARWFALRYDGSRDELHFAWIPADMHRALTFISDLPPNRRQLRVLPRSAASTAPSASAPLHSIMHSGLGGSTLLARALAAPGVVTTLKEPPILTDVVAYGLDHSPSDRQRLLVDIARLFARPFGPGEAVVCKMSSVGNALGTAIAQARAGSQILCLQTTLEQMLASLAAKGAEGRLGGRRLFVGLRNSRVAELGFSEEELSEQSDLRLAALAWLSIQRLMLESAAQFGPERVRSITSDQLIRRQRDSLVAIAGHFRLQLDVDRQLASGVFGRHAKTGEPFDAGSREKAQADSLRLHEGEIRPVVDWARKVADANLIAWDLPDPLLD